MAEQYRKTVRHPETGDTLVVGNAGEYASLTQGQGWVDATDEPTTADTKSAGTDAATGEIPPATPATPTGGKTATAK